MPRHKHIIINEPGQQRDYTSTQKGGGVFSIPLRDRQVHARRLLEDVNQAKANANVRADETGHTIHGICLEIIGEENFKLKIESLQDYKLNPHIEVLSVKKINNQDHATIYVPEGKLKNFIKKIERYETENQ